MVESVRGWERGDAKHAFGGYTRYTLYVHYFKKFARGRHSLIVSDLLRRPRVGVGINLWWRGFVLGVRGTERGFCEERVPLVCTANRCNRIITNE